MEGPRASHGQKILRFHQNRHLPLHHSPPAGERSDLPRPLSKRPVVCPDPHRFQTRLELQVGCHPGRYSSQSHLALRVLFLLGPRSARPVQSFGPERYS